jgi:hypothetical protein
MPRHLHSADIEYLWALALITITFVRISALLALKRHSPCAAADFLSGGRINSCSFNGSVVFLATGTCRVDALRPFVEG